MRLLNFRVSEDQRAELLERANGENLSAYIRRCLFADEPRGRPAPPPKRKSEPANPNRRIHAEENVPDGRGRGTAPAAGADEAEWARYLVELQRSLPAPNALKVWRTERKAAK